jgi:hypothetical protein
MQELERDLVREDVEEEGGAAGPAVPGVNASASPAELQQSTRQAHPVIR